MFALISPSHRHSHRSFAALILLVTSLSTVGGWSLPGRSAQTEALQHGAEPQQLLQGARSIASLSAENRNLLEQGKVLVTGEKGQYKAQVLINSTLDTAWSVLTDYDKLAQFVPNLESSKILESQGNRTIVEQVGARQVLFVRVRSRVRSELKETAKTRIDFQLLEGDLAKLQGYWQVEPVLTTPNHGSPQVLVTQVIEAQPKDGVPKGIFYSIFKDSLAETLGAIRQETLRRGPSS
jgi:ribosome-associated toxin RatA of RatAB toxin-antitoxin module